MNNAKNIYFPQAKKLQKKLLELDICSEFSEGYLNIEGYYGFTRFSFKEIAESKEEVLRTSIEESKRVGSR